MNDRKVSREYFDFWKYRTLVRERELTSSAGSDEMLLSARPSSAREEKSLKSCYFIGIYYFPKFKF